MAFILEPMVGAALGCVPAVPGYLKAMQDVCHKYGSLLIFDEVMCGSGRTGTLHAWQAENIVPDIQTMAKGLGGGYVPISAVLATEKVVKVIKKGSGEFVHGQTYEGMPATAVGALEVQKFIQDNNLLENVSLQGAYLGERLKALLGNHPNVGDIRGQGLFWGIEFVKDKVTKEPFDPKLEVAKKIVDLAFSPQFKLLIYYGGNAGYHIHLDRLIIAPPFIIKKKEVDHIVKVVSKVVHIVCNEINNNSSDKYGGSNTSYLTNKRYNGVRVNKFSTQAIVRDSVTAFDKPFNNYKGSTRAYSTSLMPESIKNKGGSFYEWFGGFTDAEGTFYFKKQNNLHYVFIYQITLHVDDVDVLTRIKDILGLGKITISKSVCAYTINKQEEIKEIIKIFTKYPLNSTKRLNFLAFKEAFELYINSKAKNTNLEGLELIQRLELIKSGMNSKRSDFQLSEEHIYHITPTTGVVGFIEGVLILKGSGGSFYIITKDFQLVLDIGQSAVDSALMVAIQDFFNKLPGENLSKFKDDNLVSLNQKKQQKENHRYTYKLSVANTAYIRDVLIPFFDSLT